MSQLLDTCLDATRLQAITRQLLADGDCLQLADHAQAVQQRIERLRAAGDEDSALDLHENDLCLLTERFEGTTAHAWTWVVDYEGDPSVYRGTNDLSRWMCRRCEREGSNWRRDPKYLED